MSFEFEHIEVLLPDNTPVPLSNTELRVKQAFFKNPTTNSEVFQIGGVPVSLGGTFDTTKEHGMVISVGKSQAWSSERDDDQETWLDFSKTYGFQSNPSPSSPQSILIMFKRA